MDKAKNIAEVEQLIAEHKGPLVVLFTAISWCGYCKTYKPVFEKVAKEFRHVRFVVFDVGDDVAPYRRAWSLRGVPTTIAFLRETERSREVGALSVTGLREWLREQFGTSLRSFRVLEARR